MERGLRSRDTNIYLVHQVTHQISIQKLPSNQQILSVLFYNIRKVKLALTESTNLVARECLIFWKKVGISTSAIPHCTNKNVFLLLLNVLEK